MLISLGGRDGCEIGWLCARAPGQSVVPCRESDRRWAGTSRAEARLNCLPNVANSGCSERQAPALGWAAALGTPLRSADRAPHVVRPGRSDALSYYGR